MIAVSLLDWLRTGQFGPVRLGFARAQLQELLGRPDDIGGTSRKHRTPAVWKYGDIEFHFGGRDGPLWLIHLDDFAIPTGGPAIALDPWIVRGGLSREDVERELIAQGIGYRRVASHDHNGTRIAVDSGVVLGFVDRQEAMSPPSGLFALSHSASA